MIEDLNFHQPINKEKFIFRKNPNYMPADLDSEDEDPLDFVNSKKGGPNNDTLDIDRANELVEAKFEDDEIRHLPDDDFDDDGNKIPKETPTATTPKIEFTFDFSATMRPSKAPEV
jgi:hypothetical protein